MMMTMAVYIRKCFSRNCREKCQMKLKRRGKTGENVVYKDINTRETEELKYNQHQVR